MQESEFCVIAFTQVKLPYGWLGNMSPHGILYPDSMKPSLWKTAEALFQALRFDPKDPVVEELRVAKSPMTAKMLAKACKARMTTEPRSVQDVDLMRSVLKLKLKCHPTLAILLEATGDATLIEDVSARPSSSGLFWGASNHGLKGWHGTNQLGKLWMELRAGLGNLTSKGLAITDE